MTETVPEGYYALIGNYYVGKTIGKGTFGKVKMGLHSLTMQNVAIKILDKDKILDESDNIRVQREIQILRKIRHPNIIQLYEIIESSTQLFLITEYAPNFELFNYIVKRNRLNERQSARFLLQIVNAVEYLHENHIVHRDLKPENLLLDYNDNIKVVDFGLSNSYEEGQTLKTACGSPCYAAPEMVSGKRYQGIKTDLWSSGIILYAMLCGYLPFEDSNTAELYKKIISSPLKMPEFLNERAQSILNGMLEKDPEKRLTIEQIRKHEFCLLNSNQPVLKGISFGKDEILVDPLLLSLIKDNFSINAEQAKKHIQNNKHDQVTATYYLLLNAHIRNGGVSVADISRPPPKKQQPITIVASSPSKTEIPPTSPGKNSSKSKLSQEDFENTAETATATASTSPLVQQLPSKQTSDSSSPKKKTKMLIVDCSPTKKQTSQIKVSKGEMFGEMASSQVTEELSASAVKKQNYFAQNQSDGQQKIPPVTLLDIHLPKKQMSDDDKGKEIPDAGQTKKGIEITCNLRNSMDEFGTQSMNSNKNKQTTALSYIQNPSSSNDQSTAVTPVNAINSDNVKKITPSQETETGNKQTKNVSAKKEIINDTPTVEIATDFPTHERENIKINTNEIKIDHLDEFSEMESPQRYKVTNYKIGKFIVGQQQPPPFKNTQGGVHFQKDPSPSSTKIRMSAQRVSNVHSQTIAYTKNSNNSNQSGLANSINISTALPQNNISIVATAAAIQREPQKQDTSPITASSGGNTSLSFKNYLIKSSINGSKNTFSKNFVGIIQHISKANIPLKNIGDTSTRNSADQQTQMSSYHRRNETEANSSYYQNSKNSKNDNTCLGNKSTSKRRVVTQEDDPSENTNGLMIAEEEFQAGNQSKNGSRHYHKTTKSDSINISKKSIPPSQKENIEDTFIPPQKQGYLATETLPSNIPNQINKQTNEKINMLLRQPQQKTNSLSLAIREQNYPYKAIPHQQQQPPVFFANQSYSISQHIPSSTIGNNNGNTSLPQQVQQSSRDQNQADSQMDASSVRQRLKQISLRMPGTLQSALKVRVRKSATPESYLVSSSLSQTNNITSSQRRSNSNLQLPASQDQQCLSPPKQSNQLSARISSTRRLVSAGRNRLIGVQTEMNESIEQINNKLSTKAESTSKQLHPPQEALKVSMITKNTDSPLFRKDLEASNGNKYYLGQKQQAPQKDPFQANLITNHKEPQQQINSVSVTADETQKIQQISQKQSNTLHQNAYYMYPPPNVSTQSNKSAYYHNISTSSRFSNQQQINESLGGISKLIQQTQETSKSGGGLKIKTLSSSTIPNSYSLVNVSKSKVRKSQQKSSQGNITANGNFNNL